MLNQLICSILVMEERERVVASGGVGGELGIVNKKEEKVESGGG